MKNKEYINEQVDNTYKVLEAIKKVEINHFFKHKVLQQLNENVEENKSVISWFTPQLQMATFCVVLLLNVGTIFYAFSSSEVKNNSNIETFAQEYSLQSKNNSILN